MELPLFSKTGGICYLDLTVTARTEVGIANAVLIGIAGLIRWARMMGCPNNDSMKGGLNA